MSSRTSPPLPSLGPDVQREALWRAAELYQKDGQRVDAQRVYETIVRRFPQPFPEAMEARLAAG